MTVRHLVVSGVYRSGTTFVERLLDNSSSCRMASQPVPLLYIEAKRRFLKSLGVEPGPYPIGSGFRDPAHRPVELADLITEFAKPTPSATDTKN